MLNAREATDPAEWDGLVNGALGHPLQLWEWGRLKEQTGPWNASRVVFSDADGPVGCAQILTRRLPFPFRAICYAPRGPVAFAPERLPEVADAAAAWAREHKHPVSLKIDPAVEQLDLGPQWRAGEHVLIATTAILDLTPEAEDVMRSLHSKNARNYIRHGQRRGIVVERGTRADLDEVVQIYQRTAERDAFPIHVPDFYRTAFDVLGDSSQLLVARFEGRLLAFLWNVASRGTAFELWAGATDEGRHLRANYPLKWGAMLAAKESGTRVYDMNGLLNDGISEFKRSFVKQETRWVGTFDRPLGAWYTVWARVLPAYRRLRGGSGGSSD